MNRMNTPYKPIRLATLLLMLGLSLAATAEPMGTPAAAIVTIQTQQTSETPAVVKPESILLAWDRVGSAA
jgi:hypothetical protein